jgi:hypothetical protein
MKIDTVAPAVDIPFRKTESPRDLAFSFLKRGGVHIENLEVVRHRQQMILDRVRRPVLGYSFLAMQFAGGILTLLALASGLGLTNEFGQPEPFVASLVGVLGVFLVWYGALLSVRLKTRLFARWKERSLEGFALPPNVAKNVERARELLPGATFWVETFEDDPALFVQMHDWTRPLCLAMWGFERYLD